MSALAALPEPDLDAICQRLALRRGLAPRSSVLSLGRPDDQRAALAFAGCGVICQHLPLAAFDPASAGRFRRDRGSADLILSLFLPADLAGLVRHLSAIAGLLDCNGLWAACLTSELSAVQSAMAAQGLAAIEVWPGERRSTPWLLAQHRAALTH